MPQHLGLPLRKIRGQCDDISCIYDFHGDPNLGICNYQLEHNEASVSGNIKQDRENWKVVIDRVNGEGHSEIMAKIAARYLMLVGCLCCPK